MNCPCNPTQLYKDCCGIAHKNISKVQTAEQLMRSRYTAFVLADIPFLKKSHHSTTRPDKREYKAIERWTRSLKWIRLEILSTLGGREKDTFGSVAFKAYFYQDGHVQELYEHSTFSKENGHWVYVDRHEA